MVSGQKLCNRDVEEISEKGNFRESESLIIPSKKNRFPSERDECHDLIYTLQISLWVLCGKPAKA